MRPILARMTEAKAMLLARRRTPRVFFLNAADFDAFAATKPGTVEAMFALGGFKPAPLTCLAFDGIAVRHSQQKRGRLYSKLYCCAGTCVMVREK